MSDEWITDEQVVAQAVAPFVETVGDAAEAATAVLEALREAGFDVCRLDDMTEEWWCLTHALPGDRDLNDLDAIRRRCFAHRIKWDRPRWTQLKCRMVSRTVLVPDVPKTLAGGEQP